MVRFVIMADDFLKAQKPTLLQQFTGLAWAACVCVLLVLGGTWADGAWRSRQSRIDEDRKQAAARAEAEQKSQAEAARLAHMSSLAGRFQVVNPTPALARNVMLLDTWTGATSMACVGEGGVSGWCQMPSWDAAAKGPQDR